jgi:hypothetical protein
MVLGDMQAVPYWPSFVPQSSVAEEELSPISGINFDPYPMTCTDSPVRQRIGAGDRTRYIERRQIQVAFLYNPPFQSLQKERKSPNRAHLRFDYSRKVPRGEPGHQSFR